MDGHDGLGDCRSHYINSKFRGSGGRSADKIGKGATSQESHVPYRGATKILTAYLDTTQSLLPLPKGTQVPYLPTSSSSFVLFDVRRTAHARASWRRAIHGLSRSQELHARSILSCYHVQ